MSEPITVKVDVAEISKRVYEIRTIMKGKFYKRQYIGYTRKEALELFEDWLEGHL